MENETLLKKWMARTGTSGVQLAKKMGVTSTAVYKWANGEGRPGYDRAVKLSKLTDISVSDLMGGSK